MKNRPPWKYPPSLPRSHPCRALPSLRLSKGAVKCASDSAYAYALCKSPSPVTEKL